MDLLYGPDFDEQIAVKPSGGISKEDFAMQLGNGWMNESVNAHIDNTAIGAFITDQIGKTLDLARSAAKLIPGLSALQGQITTTGAQPSAVKALVKITTVEFVVPDIYPVYKPRELMECAVRAPTTDSGCTSGVAGWGDSLRFHTRPDVLLQVVTTLPSGTADEKAGGAASPGATANSAAVNAALMGDAQAKLKASGVAATVKDVVGDTASGRVSVTIACPDLTNSAALKKAAGRVLTPDVFQGHMPGTTAVLVKCDNGA